MQNYQEEKHINHREGNIHQEMKNDHKETLNNHKEMQNDHKETPSNHKEMQNDYNEVKHPQRDTKLPQRCKTITKHPKNPMEMQYDHRETLNNHKEAKQAPRDKNDHRDAALEAERSEVHEAEEVGLPWLK